MGVKQKPIDYEIPDFSPAQGRQIVARHVSAGNEDQKELFLAAAGSKRAKFRSVTKKKSLAAARDFEKRK